MSRRRHRPAEAGRICDLNTSGTIIPIELDHKLIVPAPCSAQMWPRVRLFDYTNIIAAPASSVTSEDLWSVHDRSCPSHLNLAYSAG